MPWYHHFFHGLPQAAWKAAQTEAQTQLDLELIVETLAFGPGDCLLDVFCGYGRHALPLARMGARVTGVDISPEYTAELRSQAGGLPLEIIEGDALTVPIPGRFDAAYCLGNSFSFFPRSTLLTFLSRLAGLLKPGGRFLVHSAMVAESLLPDYQARSWQPIGLDGEEPILFLADNEYDPLEGRLDAHLTYVHKERTEVRLAQHYVFTVAELRDLFAQAGMPVTACFGTVDGDAYQLGDEGVWLLAKKS